MAMLPELLMAKLIEMVESVCSQSVGNIGHLIWTAEKWIAVTLKVSLGFSFGGSTLNSGEASDFVEIPSATLLSCSSLTEACFGA